MKSFYIAMPILKCFFLLQKRKIVYLLVLFSLLTLHFRAQGQNFVWAKQVGGSETDNGNSIATDANGNVYITGNFEATVDFDPGAGSFNLTSNGGSFYSDIFIEKLDANGNFLWAKQIGGIGNDYGWSIATDDSGNVYTTGRFKGQNVDFDPGAGIFNLSSGGGSSYDIFIEKLSSNGSFVWAKQMGGTADDMGLSITMDLFGNIFTTGSFQGIVDFDPDTGIFNLNSTGSEDIFIQKLDANGNFLWANSIQV